MGIFARRGAKACAIAFAGALAFGASASALDSDGDEIHVDGDVDVDAGMVGPQIWRFADEDRVGTALQAAERTTIGDGWGDTVIIASSEVFADALAATPLADVLNAPVLLNKPGSTLDPRVADYIGPEGEDFSRVILVGGTDVFGASLKDSLENQGFDVDRASGANRYQTARELALLTLGNVDGGMDAVNVFLASGLDFPDALAAGAAAANNDGIVLLTKGAEGLDKATYDSLRLNKLGDFEQNSIIAVGGPAAAAVQSGWDNTPIEVNDTVVGDNRYETATLLAAEYVADASNAVIASGENFPDGVVGGAFASNVDGPLLLTKEGSLTKVTRDYLEDNRNDFNGVVGEQGNIFLFGGVNSVSKNVSVQLASLEWTF